MILCILRIFPKRCFAVAIPFFGLSETNGENMVNLHSYLNFMLILNFFKKKTIFLIVNHDHSYTLRVFSHVHNRKICKLRNHKVYKF